MAVNNDLYERRQSRRESRRESAAQRTEIMHATHSSKHMDTPMLFMVILLMATGLLALYTASYVYSYYYNGDGMYYLSKQGIFAVAGIFAMLVISRINYHIYGFFHKYFFGVVLILMYLTPVIGQTRKGAKRWIGIGDTLTFQPSELMKVAVIISFAYVASQMATEDLRTLRKGVVPFLEALAVIAGAMVLQHHLSGTIIICAIGLIVLFVAGIKVWYFVPVGVIGSIAAIAYILTNTYAQNRVASWLDPFLDLRDTGWQAAMSHIAIGSGGVWGLGLGQGRQKHLFIPEPANDFVFSAWCEEMGLFGALLVLIMFSYLIYRGFYIARSSRDKFGCLLATGITTKLAIQTLLNLFVVTGIFPVTGASLPFFSYGGTALLIQLGEMGILLNVSRHTIETD